ncbi:MAG: hypothetical protein OXG24_01605 [Gammaproteobacteria bacterium]|nr:hypothetical protein [Gammaproteobacteria bacterium]
MTDAQFVEPGVSRRKFNREIAEFRSHGDQFQKRGWFLAHSKFPNVCVVLATRKTSPVMLMLGVALNYSNYDLVPPSVQLVHPISGKPYKGSELPTPLPRLLPTSDLNCVPPRIETQPFMQAYGPDEVPFLCVAGVREYHEHPAHSGDAWELHRPNGAGRLVRLIEIIDKYGPDVVESIAVEMTPKVHFGFGVPPQ